MMELLPLLKKLTSTSGLSGHEAPVGRLVEETWEPLVDEISISRLGSVQGLRRGSGSEPRPSLLIAAHMDSIGLMVSGVMDGFLRVTSVGGIDERVLPGQLVEVHAHEKLAGIIAQPPQHLLPDDIPEGPVPLEYLLVDVGLMPAEVEDLVRVGDLVSFAQPHFEMGVGYFASQSLDNRASVAAVSACLDRLYGRPFAWDVWAVATVQEEETFAGAYTSAFDLRPTLAVAVDVTFGASPGSPEHKTFPLGKGPTLGWGPNIHPALHKAFVDVADRLEIPYQLEAIPAYSGTDAVAMQVAAEGIPTMLVCIPLSYMHTPVEVVALKDIDRAARLLAEFAVSLDDDFTNKLVWDDDG